MFKTAVSTLKLLGLLALAVASLARPRRKAVLVERRHPEKRDQDGDEMIHRRKDDDAGGEN